MKKGSAFMSALTTLALVAAIAAPGSAFAIGSAKQAKKQPAKPVTLAKATTTATPAPAAAGATSAEVKTVEPTLIDKIVLKYDGSIYGPSIGKFNSTQPDEYGKDGDPVSLESIVTAGYRVTKDVVISAKYASLMALTREKGDRNEELYGPTYVMNDPWLQVQHNSLINSGPANVYLDGRVYAPLSSSSQLAKRVLSVRTTQIVDYEFPASRFTLEWASYIRSYFYSPDGKGNDWKLYMGPNLQYKISPTLTATLLYEAVATHKFGADPGLDAAGTDLEPGISWDITPKINFSPYLNFYPGGKFISSDTIGVGANFTVKVL
jgi:hypothetical protein